MSLAVIKTGGKQYKVKVDDIIKVEKLDNKPSEILEFVDLLDHKKVKAKVLEQGKNKKIRIFKFKNKTGYHKTQGHRQLSTTIKIESIL